MKPQPKSEARRKPFIPTAQYRECVKLATEIQINARTLNLATGSGSPLNLKQRRVMELRFPIVGLR